MSEERCNERVIGAGQWGAFHMHQCTRKVWKDGKCKQHHPDTVKERDAKRHAEWNAQYERDRKKWQLQAAAPDLLEALKRIEKGCSFPEDEVQKTIRDVARAAIEKAEKEA